MSDTLLVWHTAYAYYAALGCVAGTIAGLLGVGGGIVVVPALVAIFTWQSVTHDYLMQMAIGTSLATIVVTSLSSVWAHHKRGAIYWDFFKRIVPGVMLGTVLGSSINDELSTRSLQVVFGIFMFASAAQMLLEGKNRVSKANTGRTSFVQTGTVGMAIGTVSSLLGIAGGSLMVPYLKYVGLPIRNAVATSAATGFPLAIVGAFSFILTGLDEMNLPPLSTGYVYWPAFLFIAVPSAMCAPLGAKLAHSLPTAQLKLLFAFFLMLVGLKMLWG